MQKYNELAPERPTRNWKQMDTELMLLRGRVADLETELNATRFMLIAILKTIGGKIVVQPKTLREMPRNIMLTSANQMDGSIAFSIQEPNPTEVSDE